MFAKRSNLYRHIRLVHKDLRHLAKRKKEKQRVNCEICGRFFSSSSMLKRHRALMHADRVSEDIFWHEEEEPESSEEGTIEEHDSERGSPPPPLDDTADNIDREPTPDDINREPNSEHVFCYFCSKRFFDHYGLKQHMKIRHPPKKHPESSYNRNRYRCPFCEKAFPRADTVRTHVKRRHKDYLDPDEVQQIEENEMKQIISDDEGEVETELDEGEWLRETLRGSNAANLYKTYRKPVWTHNTRFRCREGRLSFRLTAAAIRASDRGFPFEVLRNILGHIVDRNIRRDPSSWIQIKLDSTTLDYPLLTESSPDVDFILSAILDQAYRVLGSKDRFMIDSPLRIEITHISPRNTLHTLGALVRYNEADGLDQYCKLIKSCWIPPTILPEYSCLGAVIVAALRISKCKLDQVRYGKQDWFRNPASNSTFQESVTSLYQQAGVSKFVPQGYADFYKFQMLLNRKRNIYGSLQLVAYNSPDPADIFFSGTPHQNEQKHRINVAVSGTHVYLILNLNQFLKRKICLNCSQFYKNGDEHSCVKVCSDCDSKLCYQLQQTEPSWYAPEMCVYCRRVFFNKFCLDNHERNDICSRYIACMVCFKIIPRKYLGQYSLEAEDHDCSGLGVFCKFCHRYYPPPKQNEKPHYCHIKRPNPLKVRTPKRYYIIVYDYETIVRKVRGVKKHYPFLATAIIFCEKCFDRRDEDWEENCETPGNCSTFFQRCFRKKTIHFRMWPETATLVQ